MKPDNKKWMLVFMVLLVFALASSLVMAAVDFGEIWHSIWTYPIKLIVNFAIVYFIFIVFSQTILERLDAMMGAKGQKADITQGVSGFFLYAIGLIIAVISAFALGSQYIWEWMLAAKILQPMVKFFWDGTAMRWDLLINTGILMIVGAALKNFLKPLKQNGSSKEAGWVMWIIILIVALFLANNIEQTAYKMDLHQTEHNYYVWKHPWGARAYYYLLGNENCVVDDATAKLSSNIADETQQKNGLIQQGVQPTDAKITKIDGNINNLQTQLKQRQTDLTKKVNELHKQDKKTRNQINTKRYCYTEKAIKSYISGGDKNPTSEIGINEDELVGYGILRGDHLFVLIGGTLLMLYIYKRKLKSTGAPLFEKGSKMSWVLSIFIAATSAHSGWTKIELIDLSYYLIIVLMYQSSKMEKIGWKFGLYYAIVDSFAITLFNHRPDFAWLIAKMIPAELFVGNVFLASWIRGMVIGMIAQWVTNKNSAVREALTQSRNEGHRRSRNWWLERFSGLSGRLSRIPILRNIFGDVAGAENRMLNYYGEMMTDIQDLQSMKAEFDRLHQKSLTPAGLTPAELARVRTLEIGDTTAASRCLDLNVNNAITLPSQVPDDGHPAYDPGVNIPAYTWNGANWIADPPVPSTRRNKSIRGTENYLRRMIIIHNWDNIQQANRIIQMYNLGPTIATEADLREEEQQQPPPEGGAP